MVAKNRNPRRAWLDSFVLMPRQVPRDSWRTDDDFEHWHIKGTVLYHDKTMVACLFPWDATKLIVLTDDSVLAHLADDLKDLHLCLRDHGYKRTGRMMEGKTKKREYGTFGKLRTYEVLYETWQQKPSSARRSSPSPSTDDAPTSAS